MRMMFGIKWNVHWRSPSAYTFRRRKVASEEGPFLREEKHPPSRTDAQCLVLLYLEVVLQGYEKSMTNGQSLYMQIMTYQMNTPINTAYSISIESEYTSETQCNRPTYSHEKCFFFLLGCLPLYSQYPPVSYYPSPQSPV